MIFLCGNNAIYINIIYFILSRPDYVVDRVFDLFGELNATDAQMDFDICYASGLNGVAGEDHKALSPNLTPLFDKILKLPQAQFAQEAPLQLLIANIDYDDFKGKLGIGRIKGGTIRVNEEILCGKPDQEYKKSKIQELFVFNNLGRQGVDSATAGDIVMIAGVDGVSIGDTIMSREQPCPLEPIHVEEPTVRMSISVNKSPLAGREGKHLQTRVIRDRLFKELEKNVALKVYETNSTDTYEICGRGQLHLTVLIENMRREGFEMMIGPPTVIEKVEDGVRLEPFESVEITVPNEFSSNVIDMMNKRKGEMHLMEALSGSEGFTFLKFLIPTRGLIGIRSALLTATKGTMIMDTSFDSYRKNVGVIGHRDRGSLLAFENGVSTGYGLFQAQERGRMFITPREEVYKDMIIGVHQRPGDLAVNVCRTKQLTNMRAAGSDENIKLVPPLELNLDLAVEYIQEDELVEVTPTKVRMLKNPDFKDHKKKNH